MQILSCSGTIGTCCGDFGLVLIIDTTRRVLNLIQMAVPIMLIIWATIDVMKLVMDPEAKNGKAKLLKKFFAAIIVFFLPVFINATMGLLNTDFKLKACWNQAKNKAEIAKQSNTKYINPYGDDAKTTSILPKPEGYDSGTKTNTNTSSGTNESEKQVSVNSATEKDVVAYAKSFVGGRYCLGGYDPHNCADCTGFVRYILNHFSTSDKKLGSRDLPKKDYPHPENFVQVSPNNLRGGDVVVYPSHFALATGNGREIIHAANPKDGIIISPSYNPNKAVGFYRYKYLKK